MNDNTEHIPSHSRYLWQKRLQKSIFGEIQMALDTCTQTQVAVKLSKTSLLDQKEEMVVEDPRQEVELINFVNSKGTHENVIEVLDSFQMEGYECVVLPFCPNGDVFERVGTLSKEENWSVFIQVVNGLSHIHAQGIAHLDISLENVLINGEGILKICDFGLARKFSDSCSRVGKVFYMAPEILYTELQGDKYDCRMGDMYSLGVCLFILYLGFPPYQAPTHKDRSFLVLAQHGVRALLQAYGVLDKVPETVIEILQILLCPLQRRVDIVHLGDILLNQQAQQDDDNVDDFFNFDQDFNPSNFTFE